MYNMEALNDLIEKQNSELMPKHHLQTAVTLFRHFLALDTLITHGRILII